MAGNRDAKLYQRIADDLRASIERGDYGPGDKLPTEQMLAAQFGVSRITSKRALDDLAASGLIVRKQGSGSFVGQGRTQPPRDEGLFRNTVSIIMPYNSLRGRFVEIVQSSSDALSSRGWNVIISNSEARAEAERRLMERAWKIGARGVILYPVWDNQNLDMLYNLYANRFPLVVVDKRLTDVPVNSVCSDNRQGAYDLTTYLIECGHTHIRAFYNVNISTVSSARQRYFGYCDAMRDHGLSPRLDPPSDARPRWNDGASREERIRYTAKAVEAIYREGTTAVLLENDYNAQEILCACASLGIRVPEDLSVVGFDNLPESAHTEPPLTTCDQDFAGIGTLAAELLLRQMEKGDFTWGEHSLPTKLCLRQSVKDMRLDR